jgi:hypothetical protein
MNAALRKSSSRGSVRTGGIRGFAMPIVIILALVVTIMAAVMLERQGAQRLSVQRQLNLYRDHHFQRGVREVAGAWTDSLGGQPIDKMIDTDGHALDIELADGGHLSVYLFDAQGSTRSDPRGLNEEEKADAGGVYEQVLAISDGKPNAMWFRPVGPVKICVASAPREILEAVANYASDGGRAGKRFADELIDTRERQDLTQADIQTACSAAGLNAEQIQVLNRLVVLKAELWAMVIDVYEAGRSSNSPVARYMGRFVPPGAQSGGPGTSLQTLGKFLTWEELPLAEQARR